MYFRMLLLLMISHAGHAQVDVLAGASESEWGFGTQVKIDGEVAVVGVPYGEGNTSSSGFVYVYEKNGGDWHQTAKLTSELTDDSDLYGYALDVSQGRIFVSAPNADAEVDGAILSRSGLVFVYEKTNGLWQHTQTLQPLDAEAADGFGIRLFASVGRVFVSKADYDAENGTASGGVYVFDDINDSWKQTAFIEEQEVLGVRSTLGGWDISYDDGTLVVPYLYLGPRRSVQSILYVYTLNGSSWDLQDTIASPFSQPNDCFGCSLSINGDRLAVAAANESQGFGAVYLYERTNQDWQLIEQFRPDNIFIPKNFGSHIALGVDQLMIGSRLEFSGTNGDYGEGAVFIYELFGENWQLTRTLEAPGNQGHNDFGEHMDLDHDQFIVGAPHTDNEKGAVYVFEITPTKKKLPINAGLNGSWLNLKAPGQGIFLDVSSTLDFSFLGWFTYDAENPDHQSTSQVGSADQRWLVGAGEIDQRTSSISFQLYYAHDGLFDDSREVITSDVGSYGNLLMEFKNCGEALVTYHLFESGLSNSFWLTRPTPGSADLCDDLSSTNAINDGFDYRLNGAWFNPLTGGQGIFLEKFKGIDTTFMGWFTFDTMLPSTPDNSVIGAQGQRWLVGTGAHDINMPNVLNYELYYTSNGLFDDPKEVTVVPPGEYGTLQIEFTDCANAKVTYRIGDQSLFGQFNMIKAVPNESDCALTETH